MNYDTVKTADQVKLSGIKVTFEKVGDTLKAVFFRDAAGNLCRVTLDSYCLSVNVPAGPKLAKRYVLRGDLPLVGRFEKHFETEYEAKAAARELESTFRGDIDLNVTHEEVEVEPATVVDEIPF